MLKPSTLVKVVSALGNPHGVFGHLRLLLQARSGCTTFAHARRYEGFHDWLKTSNSKIGGEPHVRVAVLFRRLTHLKDQDAKRTVSLKILESLGWASSFLLLFQKMASQKQATYVFGRWAPSFNECPLFEWVLL